MAWNSYHPYRILIVAGSEYEKTNALLNLINYGSGIDKIYLYVRDLYEPKYQLPIKKKEKGQAQSNETIKAFYWVLEWYIWIIFTNILKNTIQIRNRKY